MKIESTNIRESQPFGLVLDKSTKENEKTTTGKPNYDNCQISHRSFLDENEIPKNFLVKGKFKLPHGNETEMLDRIRNIYGSYFTGEVDEASVENTLSDVVDELRSNYLELGYDEETIMPHIIEDVYETARLFLVLEAGGASNQEGQKIASQYTTEEHWTTKDIVYYNSDYYYSCENMKASLLKKSQELGEKYGVFELNLPIGYEKSDPRYCYSSYNTDVNDYAGFQRGIGNMLDDSMVPPENFRFFYKDDVKKFPDSLPEREGDVESMLDGILQVWYGDWTFIDRVPLHPYTPEAPISFNMFDLVNKDSNPVPQEISSFLKNFDIFSMNKSRLYFASQARAGKL